MTTDAWEPALDGLPTGVALVGADGTIRWVNRAGAAVLGGTRRLLAGVRAPFTVEAGAEPGESLCTWLADAQSPRWLAYTEGADVHLGVEGTLVVFRESPSSSNSTGAWRRWRGPRRARHPTAPWRRSWARWPPRYSSPPASQAPRS
ncbi:hypothetical protein [Streptomyces griseoruber]|uniref:hypothetical protein n=1 Tax=Streptomyces griseoruber TaxID=1943 RepID=UPI000B1B35A1|nr:hypothetical protein [Streptomyces griseoruber]